MYSELTPQTENCLIINGKRCKGAMSASIGSLLLSLSSGDGLHLGVVTAPVCNAGVCCSRAGQRAPLPLPTSDTCS
jgi:hypothetical protein